MPFTEIQGRLIFQNKDNTAVSSFFLKNIYQGSSNNFKVNYNYSENLFDISSIFSSISCILAIENFDFLFNTVPIIIYADENNIRIKYRNKNKEMDFDVYKGHSDSITCLLHVPEKNYLLSGSKDKSLIVWNFPRKANCNDIVRTIKSNHNSIYSLLLLNNSKLASACTELINIWSLEDFRCLKQISAHSDRIVNLKNIDNNYFVSASYDKTIKIWKSDGEYDCERTYKDELKITCLEVTKNLEIITITEDNKLNLWKAY